MEYSNIIGHSRTVSGEDKYLKDFLFGHFLPAIAW